MGSLSSRDLRRCGRFNSTGLTYVCVEGERKAVAWMGIRAPVMLWHTKTCPPSILLIQNLEVKALWETWLCTKCHGVRRACQLSLFKSRRSLPSIHSADVLSVRGVTSRHLGGILMLSYVAQVEDPLEKYIHLSMFGKADSSCTSFGENINEEVLGLPYPAKWSLWGNV